MFSAERGDYSCKKASCPQLMCFSTYSSFAAKALQFNILESALTGIEAAMNKTFVAHDAVNSASRTYFQALSAVTLAEAMDTFQAITTITLPVNVIRREITKLTT